MSAEGFNVSSEVSNEERSALLSKYDGETDRILEDNAVLTPVNVSTKGILILSSKEPGKSSTGFVHQPLHFMVV